MIDTNLNVPAQDVAFSTARLWGKFPGSSDFDVPFGTLHNFQLQCSYTLKELMDPDYLSAIAVGTEKQDFTITAQYARIRSRNLYACLGGTAPYVSGGRTILDIGANNPGPLVMAAQIKSNAAVNAPIIGTIYAMLCSQFSLDFRMRDYMMPSITAKAYVDSGSDGVSGTGKVLTLSLQGDQTVDTGAVPGVPGGFTAVAGPISGSIRLQWTAVGTATSYNIYRGLSGGGPFAYVGNTLGVNFYDTGLTPSTTYYYVITAANNSGEGAFSTVANAVATP